MHQNIAFQCHLLSKNSMTFLRPGHGKKLCWNLEHLAATPWRRWPQKKEWSPHWPWATSCQLISRPSTTAQPGTALALTLRSYALRNKVGAKVRQVPPSSSSDHWAVVLWIVIVGEQAGVSCVHHCCCACCVIVCFCVFRQTWLDFFWVIDHLWIIWMQKNT